MKKAINIAVLATSVLIAMLVCTQTVVAAGSGLFYSNQNASSSAQDFINATKTDVPQQAATQTIKKQVQQPLSVEQEASSTITPKADEGSLPLFSENTATSSNKLAPIADSISSSLSLITSLIGIIVLALAVSYVLQKKGVMGANNFGKVLGCVPLDNKRILYIVDVMGKMLVLGVTESNISLLTEITDKDTIDAYRLKYGQSVTPGLDKLFPFLPKNEEPSPQTKEQFSEAKSQLESEKQVAETKATIDENREKRIARLNNLLISQDTKQ